MNLHVHVCLVRAITTKMHLAISLSLEEMLRRPVTTSLIRTKYLARWPVKGKKVFSEQMDKADAVVSGYI